MAQSSGGPFLFFLGLNSATFHLPVGLFAFRFWILLAIPAAILTAETIVLINEKIKVAWITRLFLLIALSGIFYEAAVPRLRTNLSIWRMGNDWGSPQELVGYISLQKNLKPDTKVFTFRRPRLVIGFDMDCDYWSEEYQQSLGNAFELTEESFCQALKENEFKYIILGKKEMDFFGEDLLLRKIESLIKSPRFELVYTYQSDVWIFKII